MFTHRVILDYPRLGRLVVFVELQTREHPTTGIAQGICPGRGTIEFDWSTIVESVCTGFEGK